MLAAAVIMAQAIIAPNDRCGIRHFIAMKLEVQYGESHQFSFIQSQKIVEVWMNIDTETWTILVTDMDGMTCMNASGKGVVVGMPQPPGERH